MQNDSRKLSTSPALKRTAKGQKTLVVTGGAGFVGSNLALRFKAAKEGLRVLVLDNLKRRGSELNLERLRSAGVEFVHGDIRNPEDLLALGEFETLIECSAEPSVMAGYGESPEYVLHTNLTGTLHCLEAARRQQATIVFLSTSRVYPYERLNQLEFRETATRFEPSAKQTVAGVSPIGVSEDFSLEGPRSLYGATKLASELILTEYLSLYPMRGWVNRCGVIAGPWQMGKVDQGILSLWVARHVFNQPLQYFGYGGTGKQVRDVVHVDDIFSLISTQLEKPDLFHGKTLNVGGGRSNSVSLTELTDFCRRATGNSPTVGSVKEDRALDVKWYVSDCSKLHGIHPWKPEKTVEQIVSEMSRWMVDHRGALEPILGRI